MKPVRAGFLGSWTSVPPDVGTPALGYAGAGLRAVGSDTQESRALHRKRVSAQGSTCQTSLRPDEILQTLVSSSSSSHRR